MEPVRGLHFHDQTIVHNHVEALMSKNLAFVSNENSKLPRYSVPSRTKFAFQRHHVEVLQESEPERVVHFEERPDNRMREIFVNECGPHDKTIGPTIQ